MARIPTSTTNQPNKGLYGSQNASHELQTREIRRKPILKPSWRSLFAFTRRDHWPSLIYAVSTTILAGLIKPALSVLYGKIFATLTQFGGGKLSSKATLHDISTWCLAATALGIGAWIAEGGLMTMWIIFGELQAKTVRLGMFASMLDKDMEWYDSREEGIRAFLIRIQT